MAFSAGPSMAFVTAMFLVILLIVVWFIVATAGALKGGSVETPNRMAQMYGYTVCLIAVVVAIASVASLIDAAFDRAYPLQDEYMFGASLSSFEAYKATYSRERAAMGPGPVAVLDTASDETLRSRYDALVQDRITAARYRTSKKLVTSGLLLLVAVGLFGVHWRWVRRM